MLNLHTQHVQKHQFSKISAFPFQLALLWLSLAQVVQGNQQLYPFCCGCMILSQVWFVCCSHLQQLMLCISDKHYKQLGFLCLRSMFLSGVYGYLVVVPAQLWISDPPVQCVIPQGLSVSTVPSDSFQYVSNTLDFTVS